jgi:alpha-N-arabinofuranosidase
MRYAWSESDRRDAQLQIQADRPARRPISRYLFGKFTEHLGENVYNGLWAQILRNPGFEAADMFHADRLAHAFDRLERVGLQGLREAAARGVAPFWRPCGRPAEYALDSEAFNSGHCQRIHRSARSGSAGVDQPVFLPLHRTCEYEFSVWARSRGVDRLSVRLRHDGRTVARATLRGIGSGWARHRARLVVAEPDPAPARAFDLCIMFGGLGTVWLDQTFLFPGDHIAGLDPDVIRLWREARLPLLRFPGGNFASGYHWRDGVGPVEDRPTRPNPAWPGAEFNHVGTDEMMVFCEAVGCDPMICVNAGDGTPDEAAAWIEYCNGGVDTPEGARRAMNGHPRPYNVRLWEVGNELYGGWQIGHCDARAYAERYKRFARAMRAADPGGRLIANGHTAEWNAEVVRHNGSSVRSVSTHPLIGGSVPGDADPDGVYRALMAYAHHFPREMNRLVRPMRRAGLPARLALTELQVYVKHPHLPNNRTVAEGLWTASMLNAAIRSAGAVELVTHSALVNHGGCLLKRCERVWPEPVYFVHKLYATQRGVLPVRVGFVGPGFDAPRVRGVSGGARVPDLDVVGLLNGRKDELTVLVVNRRTEVGLKTRLALHGFDCERTVRVRELAADSFLASNTLEAPCAVELDEGTVGLRRHEPAYVFPPNSLTELVFHRAG